MRRKIKIKRPKNNISFRSVLLEKYFPLKTKTIIIRKATKRSYWYSPVIGTMYLVRDFENATHYKEHMKATSMPQEIAEIEYRKKFLVITDEVGHTYVETAINKIDCDIIYQMKDKRNVNVNP